MRKGMVYDASKYLVCDVPEGAAVIHHGDLFDVLPSVAEASIDACLTDPPYDLTANKKGGTGAASVNLDSPHGRARIGTGNGSGGFMGKAWDGTGIAFDPKTWRLVYRVLKPGAYLLAFGGTRTFHRMTVAIEDAGFEVRDCLSWLYGSGFPKSLNLPGGRGTALKPAWEPIVLARKPLRGTVASNVQQFGTGALNIGACRIESAEPVAVMHSTGGRKFEQHDTQPDRRNKQIGTHDLGRWPANVLLDEDAAALLDEQTGELTSGARTAGDPKVRGVINFGMKVNAACDASSGGASRFYYVPKPSREERDYGTDGLTARQRDDSRKDGSNPGGDNPRNRGLQPRGNFHPTVKPIELMRWLVRLVTPPGGTVLDPFTGSGTTGMACRYELRPFVGIERETDYVRIAESRIAAVTPLFGEQSA